VARIIDGGPIMDPKQPEGCVRVERRGDAVVARFAHEMVLSGAEAEAAAERLMALLAGPGSQPLLIDFGNVRSLSSLMLGKLVELSRAARSAEVRLGLFNLRPEVRGILEVTGVNLVVNLYGDEAEALRGP
jgi:anti-anti-sigma factor